MTRRSVAVLAAAVMVLWPACGESDEQVLPGRASPGAEAAATAAPPDGDGEEGFVAAANLACERAGERMANVEAPPSHREWLGFGRRIERHFSGMLDYLSALDPSRKLAGDFRKWLRKLERSRRAFRSLYRTVTFRFTARVRPDDPVQRALDRVFQSDNKARSWVQRRLTDLYSCYNPTPWYSARAAVSAACGGFYFCE
jgi:hypothetical protein